MRPDAPVTTTFTGSILVGAGPPPRAESRPPAIAGGFGCTVREKAADVR